MTDNLKVEYLQGDIMIKRSMNQIELAELLLDEGVLLLFVNKPKVRFYRKKGRGKNET